MPIFIQRLLHGVRFRLDPYCVTRDSLLTGETRKQIVFAQQGVVAELLIVRSIDKKTQWQAGPTDSHPPGGRAIETEHGIRRVDAAVR